MKEGKDGERVPFKLEVVNVGLDEYDELITSCVVAPAPSQVHESKLTSSLQYGMNTFNAASVGGAAVHRDTWRELFYAGSELAPEAKRKAFQRAGDALVEMGELSVTDDIFSLPSVF